MRTIENLRVFVCVCMTLASASCAAPPPSASGEGEVASAEGEATGGEAVDPDAPPHYGPACGGIAGFTCPGAGICDDDPRDECDPAAGGADCGGVCRCEPGTVCAPGTVFDATPEVCACVESAGRDDVCARVRCAAGTRCVSSGGSARCE